MVFSFSLLCSLAVRQQSETCFTRTFLPTIRNSVVMNVPVHNPLIKKLLPMVHYL